MDAHAALMTVTLAMTEKALASTVWAYSADGSRRTGILPGDALATEQKWCAKCRFFHPSYHLMQCPVSDSWQVQMVEENRQQRAVDSAWEMMVRRIRWEEKRHNYEHSTFCPACGVTVQQPGECRRCDSERSE